MQVLFDMNKIGILFLLVFCYFFLPVEGQAIDLSLFLDTVQIRHYTPMRSMTRIKVVPSDSIYVEKYGEMRYYNSDTLFHYLATRGYHAVEDELYYYYYDIVSYMSDVRAAAEIRKVRQIALRYNNPEVTYAAEFLPLLVNLSTADSTRFDAAMDDLYRLARKVAAEGNTREEIFLLRLIFNESYLSGHYARAFRFARLTVDRLDQLTDEEFFDRKATYFMIGNAYHVFRDYDRSIPYLKKSLRDDGARHMADRANLRARYKLAEYYASIGDLEQSDYYFLSMWNSPDQVKMRPVYDMVALTGLAGNEMKRGRFDVSLRIFKLCLPALKEEKISSLSTAVELKMAECYLEKDDQGAAYAILDSVHINPDSVDENSCYYYSLLNRYYARRGDALKARCYLDSMMTAFRRYEDKYNTLIILRAEQELFESEQARKQMQINTFQHMLFFMGITAGIILIALIIISILYRKKHQAYRKLAARSREWAEREPTVMLITEVDDADIALMEGIALLFEEERIYLDPAFDLESLSQRLGVHRNLISKAINTVYGKSFSSFINECRVRQAILLLSDPANDSLSLEAIAFDAGFSTRQTFYRVFKAQTGINPATYRKNREAQVDTY